MKHHIIVMILGLVAAQASAADSPWYFGAGGGLAVVHGGYDRVWAIPSVPSASTTPSPDGGTATVTIRGTFGVDPVQGVITESGATARQSHSSPNPSPSWNVAAGYRCSPYFAVEADYEQLPTVNGLTELSFASGPPNFVRDQTRHSELGISALGFYPLGTRCRLFGGAGLGWSWESSRTIIEDAPPSFSQLFDGAGTRQFLRAQLRAGAELSLSRHLAVRVGWDRPDANLRNWRGDNSIQELSIDNFSATALWAF